MGFTGGLRSREPVLDPRLADVCPRAWPELSCTLHFKFDGDATLYVRVFGEDGRRVGCCPKTNDGEEVLNLGDGRGEDEGEPALGGNRVSSSYGGSSFGDSSSSGGYD